MSSLPHIVLADDLTGAAEVAAIAHQAGLRAVVLTRLPEAPVAADVLVFDLDTRLTPKTEAARRVRAVTIRLRQLPHAGFFVKVDSVLRGPVLAQLAACARALGRTRTLLVPANPSLGRVIRQGRYSLNGLLGATRTPLAVCRARTRRLPRSGVVVGEAGTAADISHWAGRLDANTLAAGAADFFRAWLATQAGERHAIPDYSLPAGGVLLLHGTTVGPVNARALHFRGLRAPSAASVRAALAQHGAVAVAPVTATLNQRGAPVAISRGFADLALRLHRTRSFRHLLIAGGATAATVLHALDWSALTVARTWDTGIVTLQPMNDPDFAVTMKPGSYPWPANLRHVLLDFILS
jgi:uncharacterized protein YgbK (DUF1537 family)